MISPLTFIRETIGKHKLRRDIAWSMGSFFVLAISGVGINIAVTALRDAASLGVFNLAYAVYIVASQFATWGTHYSVLRHAAYYKESLAERSRMLCTAGFLALILGMGAASLISIAIPSFSRLFDSPQTASAIRYSALGLILFPLNKVLLAYLNGLREIKAFSILQGLRYLTVMVSVTAVAASSLPIELATLAFLAAEFITTSLAIFWMFKARLVESLSIGTHWIKLHLIFGTKGLLGGIFAEVNARVDVLLIGFFLDDHSTGIYSFAAMLVDGLYHVMAMIRINFNPILTAAVRDEDWEQARRLRIQSQKFVLPSILALSALLILAYYLLAYWLIPGKGLQEGLPSLLILLSGLNLVAIFVPFDNLMVVSGHPGYQAVQQMTSVMANVFSAAVLLPLIGIEGAAIGTAMSYFSGITMLVLFAQRLLGWRLISNKTPGAGDMPPLFQEKSSTPTTRR